MAGAALGNIMPTIMITHIANVSSSGTCANPSAIGVAMPAEPAPLMPAMR